MLADAFDGEAPVGARQIVVLDADTRCRPPVQLQRPAVHRHQGERDTLIRWAEAKGEDGLVDYRAEKNTVSLDSLPTGW